MFSVDEFVLVKRSDGSWSEAKILTVNDNFIEVEFKLGETFQGAPNPYDKNKIGYKYIYADKFETHLQKMKRHINSEDI